MVLIQFVLNAHLWPACGERVAAPVSIIFRQELHYLEIRQKILFFFSVLHLHPSFEGG
jgi:hypothetical protein